ncbi:hypothetical protein H671_6g16393 [Cricetulus griseus]|nr:hypothetical protein H671_6g16393 [Cricetulus griseus]
MLDLILLFCFKGAGDSAVMSHLAGRSSLLLSSFCLIFLPAEFFIWGPTTSLLLLKDEQQSNAHSSLNKPDSLQAYKEDKNCPLSPEQESHLLLNRIFLSKVASQAVVAPVPAGGIRSLAQNSVSFHSCPESRGKKEKDPEPSLPTLASEHPWTEITL